MEDAKIAAIARRYVWAAEEPGPDDDCADDYYTAGPTSWEILEELKQAVHDEQAARDEVAATFTAPPAAETFETFTDQTSRLRRNDLPF